MRHFNWLNSVNCNSLTKAVTWEVYQRYQAGGALSAGVYTPYPADPWCGVYASAAEAAQQLRCHPPAHTHLLPRALSPQWRALRGWRPWRPLQHTTQHHNASIHALNKQKVAAAGCHDGAAPPAAMQAFSDGRLQVLHGWLAECLSHQGAARCLPGTV